MRVRPLFNRAISTLLKDIALRMPEFAHIQASRILVVAGEARRASRAAVKPLTFSQKKLRHVSGRRKPEVRIRGRKMLYCITLRPLFFQDSTVEMRIETLLHELFHVSLKFDGTLSESRKHSRLGKAFPKRFQPLVQRYLRVCPPEVRAPFAFHGEVKMLQWLERPPALLNSRRGPMRLRYSEEQLFTSVVQMVTRSS